MPAARKGKRVTLRAVNAAAGDYARAVQLYGESNLETSRRLGTWQELRAAYERQTGRPLYQLNPPAKAIGAQVVQIRYRHAGDGKYYRHDFDRAGTRLTALPDGSLRIANPSARLWGDYGDMRFLENPPRRKRGKGKSKSKGKGRGRARAKSARRNPPARKRAKRKPPAGFATWSAYMASIRPGSRSQGGKMARKKGRRRSSARRASSTRRRRSYRRNPPMRGLVGFGMEAATRGLGVVAGQAAARAIPAAVNLPQAGTTGLAVQAAVGLGAGLLASRMFSRRFGEDMAAGAMASVYASLIKRAGVPVLSSALGDEGDVFAAYPTAELAAYPQVYGELGAYPQSGATGIPAALDMQQ